MQTSAKLILEEYFDKEILAKAEVDVRRKKVLNALKPDEVLAGTVQKIWWRCSTNPKHVWLATCSSRVHAGSGCPTCNQGEKIDLRKRKADLKMFRPRKNKGRC